MGCIYCVPMFYMPCAICGVLNTTQDHEDPPLILLPTRGTLHFIILYPRDALHQ